MSESRKVESNIKIENARIGFRNFAGKEGKFNNAGRRNFCVFLETEIAEELESDGWNIRWLQPREEGDTPQPYLQVAVQYSNRPPKVTLVTKHNRTVLDESTIDILDFAEIENVDLMLNPYNWDVQGKQGVKAYLNVMYVTIVEDEFESKYQDVPDSAANCVGPNCPVTSD